jgi:hypothetical protein
MIIIPYNLQVLIMASGKNQKFLPTPLLRDLWADFDAAQN